MGEWETVTEGEPLRVMLISNKLYRTAPHPRGIRQYRTTPSFPGIHAHPNRNCNWMALWCTSPPWPQVQPASQPSLRLQGWLAGPQAWLAGPQAWLDGPEGGTDGRMDGRTNGRKISPFYRTSSPIGAAAQKGKKRHKGKKVAQRHQMVSGSQALLFIGLKLPLGSRAAAPIGDEVL